MPPEVQLRFSEYFRRKDACTPRPVQLESARHGHADGWLTPSGEEARAEEERRSAGGRASGLEDAGTPARSRTWQRQAGPQPWHTGWHTWDRGHGSNQAAERPMSPRRRSPRHVLKRRLRCRSSELQPTLHCRPIRGPSLPPRPIGSEAGGKPAEGQSDATTWRNLNPERVRPP